VPKGFSYFEVKNTTVSPYIDKNFVV